MTSKGGLTMQKIIGHKLVTVDKDLGLFIQFKKEGMTFRPPELLELLAFIFSALNESSK